MNIAFIYKTLWINSSSKKVSKSFCSKLEVAEPFTTQQILDLLKLEAITDHKLHVNVSRNMKLVFQKIKKHYGKGRKSSLQAFVFTVIGEFKRMTASEIAV